MSGFNLASRLPSFQLRPLARRALNSRLVAQLSYPHGVDRYLEYLNPRWSVSDVRARVVDVYSQTPDTVTLRLQPNGTWDGFIPGQFVRVTVSLNGRLETRCFSPAQSLHAADGCIELTAKLHDHAYVTRYLRDELSIGEVVSLSQSDGDFQLPAKRPESILLISGGSGITPVMSMLRTLVDEAHTGAITFLHYANAAADQLYAEELEQLAADHPNITLVRCYTDGDEGELQGLFDADHLTLAGSNLRSTETFLCGPPGLMRAVEGVYEQSGISSQLHLERFTGTKVDLPPSDNAEGDVYFTQSSQQAPNNGTTLLEQAEAAGLSPVYGCRQGVCHACTCHKTAGRVKDLRTGEISGDGEEDIQICMSVPVESVAIEV